MGTLLTVRCQESRRFRLDRIRRHEVTAEFFVDEPGRTLADFFAAMAAEGHGES